MSLSQSSDPRDRSRRTQLAYRLHESDLPGIQAAVSVGLGVSILPDVAILPEHRSSTRPAPPITNTELALVVADNASAATRHLAEVLAEFCSGFGPADTPAFQSGRQRLAAKA